MLTWVAEVSNEPGFEDRNGVGAEVTLSVPAIKFMHLHPSIRLAIEITQT